MWPNSKLMFNLILFKIIIAGEVGEKCSPTENISKGICKVVTDCGIALTYIKNKEFHPFSRCGFSGKFEIVCCPTEMSINPQITDKKNSAGEDKYGQPGSLRIADRECLNIINSTIPPLDLHIIGGETASLGEFPHMVALGYEYPDGLKFQCGGSLISDIFVLTAAHCVDTLDQVPPSIARMGVIDISDNASDIRIQKIITHPDYKRRTKYHDLALLQLEQPVEFNVNLHALCLYTDKKDPTVALTITGWGKTSTTRDIRSTVLLKANVTMVPREGCARFYTNWGKLPQGISNEQICAGDPQGLRDTCQGDSGGPLQALTANDGQFRLVGVTSFGRGCGSPVPGVYTRIVHYLDWIERIVWPN